MSKILKKNYDKLRYKLKTHGLNLKIIPDAPELTNDKHLNHAFDCIRSFELQEMSYSVKCCSICNVCKINMKLKNGACENANKHTFSLQLHSQREITPAK